MTPATIPVIAIIVVFVILIFIYNNIVRQFNAVERAWSGVITHERQKNKIIPDLQKLSSEYSGFEQGVLREITELRASLDNLSISKMDTGKLMDVEAKTRQLMSKIQVSVEAYPELKASDIFSQLMSQISEQQENISAAIRIFNQNVEDFNNSIQVFPNSLVNSLLNKKSKVNPFEDKKASEGFDYRPNL